MNNLKLLFQSTYKVLMATLLILISTQTSFAAAGYTGDYTDTPYYNTNHLTIDNAQELNTPYQINDVLEFDTIILNSNGHSVSMMIDVVEDGLSIPNTDGWGVQYYVYKANETNHLQSLIDEGSYNAYKTNGWWQSDFTLEENGLYNIQFLAYCANNKQACGEQVSDKNAIRTIKYPFIVGNDGIQFHDQVISDQTVNSNQTKPDFEVSNIYLNHEEIIVTVRNNGEQYNNEDGHTYIWIDGVRKHSYNWGTLRNTDFLQKNGISEIRSQELYGNHTVKACVDANNVVSESNENNNCKTVTLSNRRPNTTDDQWVYPNITITSNPLANNNNTVVVPGQTISFRSHSTNNNITSGGSR